MLRSFPLIKTSTNLIKPCSGMAVTKSKDFNITIHKTNAMKSSPEDCIANPLVTIMKKGKSTPIQHDFYAANYCESPGCGNKVCKTPCGPITKTEYVAHGTHSDSSKVPGTVYVSKTDAAGNPKPQYAKFYPSEKRPQPSNAAETLDPVKTQNVNDNKEMSDNIALYKKFHD